MKKLKSSLVKWSGLGVSALALVVGVASANSACLFWFHQPKVPQGMDKFKNPHMRG